MLRRLQPILLLLALTARPVASAHAVSATPRAEATCREFPGLNTLFRFGTGSPPTASPAIGPDGSVYVGTTEGYVHALRADGSYHWSYTVTGAVTGRIGVSQAGLVLVPTARKIYAIRPNGRPLWVFDSPVVIRGDLVRDAADRFHFASEDGRVFALSSRGALVSHMPGKVRVTAGPLVLGDGGVVAGRSDGAVVKVFRGVFARFQLAPPVTSLITCPGARFCAIAGGVLSVVEPQDSAFRSPALRAAGSAAGIAVLPADDRLEVFPSTRAARSFGLALPFAASAAPVIDPGGTTFVPLRNGALLTVARDGRVSGCVPVARSPLGVPVVDPARHRVVVTATEGQLISIQLD